MLKTNEARFKMSYTHRTVPLKYGIEFKHGNTFELDILNVREEDYKHAWITAICEICKEEYYMKYEDYINRVSEGYDLCTKCSRRKKMNISKIDFGIQDRFRPCSLKWRKESLEHHKYKCVVTGEYSNIIHHPKSHTLIVEEAFNALGIDCTTNEWIERYDELYGLIIELHYKYGYGVCLSKKVHDAFHAKYGERTTPKQLSEYIRFVALNADIKVNIRGKEE